MTGQRVTRADWADLFKAMLVTDAVVIGMVGLATTIHSLGII